MARAKLIVKPGKKIPRIGPLRREILRMLSKRAGARPGDLPDLARKLRDVRSRPPSQRILLSADDLREKVGTRRPIQLHRSLSLLERDTGIKLGDFIAITSPGGKGRIVTLHTGKVTRVTDRGAQILDVVAGLIGVEKGDFPAISRALAKNEIRPQIDASNLTREIGTDRLDIIRKALDVLQGRGFNVNSLLKVGERHPTSSDRPKKVNVSMRMTGDILEFAREHPSASRGDIYREFSSKAKDAGMPREKFNELFPGQSDIERVQAEARKKK